MVKPVHIYIRCALTALFLVCGHLLLGQSSLEPTSATDSNIKVQTHKKLAVFSYSKYSKKSGHARITERQGESMPKRKHRASRQWSRKEARVFNRQSHFAKSSGNSRIRPRNGKKHSSRN